MQTKLCYYLSKKIMIMFLFVIYIFLVFDRFTGIKISNEPEVNITSTQQEDNIDEKETINQNTPFNELNFNDELTIMFSKSSFNKLNYLKPKIINNNEEKEIETEDDSLLNEIEIIEEELIEISEDVPYIRSIISENIPLDSVSEEIILEMNVRDKSSISAEQINNFLAESNLAGLGYIYKEMEETYEINAMFLCSISILESGWGTTKIAIDKNNLFGWGAYGSDPYTNAYTFSSKEECIRKISVHLSENYLTEGGKYYNGMTIPAVNIKYCELDSWSGKIANIMFRMNNSCY